jgi:soluble lytic murein transglycosylase
LGHALALLSTGKAKPAKELFVALRKEEATGTHLDSALRQVEGLAALRSGDRKGAMKIWLELVRDEPLTYAALTAHARLRSIPADGVPPLCAPTQSNAVAAPLDATMPAPVAALHALGLDDAAEERLTLLEAEVTSRHPGRESEALCALYGQLAGGRRQLQIGSRATSWAELMRLPSARERWTWSCVYPEPYADFVRAAEARYQVPRGLVHAIMRQESAFRVDARSEAGAQGLMQLMPNTAERAMLEIGRAFGPESDVLRPDVNVELGTFYLGKLLRSFGGSVPLAVAAYNAGPHAVREWLRAPAERELDLWVARIPYAETREYVMRVLGNFARYQYLSGGAEAITPLELTLPTEVSVGEDAY